MLTRVLIPSSWSSSTDENRSAYFSRISARVFSISSEPRLEEPERGADAVPALLVLDQDGAEAVDHLEPEALQPRCADAHVGP